VNSRKRDKPLASSLTIPTPEWLAEAVPDQQSSPSSIGIKEVHLPQSQPRRYFDPQSLAQLTDSIRQQGVLQPIVVRPRNRGGYELVAGERRFRAATAAGLNEIPAVVRELDDLAARQIALLENLQREDLNEFEETEAILDLLALHLEQPVAVVPVLLRQLFNATTRLARDAEIDENESDNNVIISPDSDASDLHERQRKVEEVFQSLSSKNWKSFVTNRLPLLKLPEDIQQVLRDGKIAYTKAKAIASVKSEEQRSQLLTDAVTQDWSLREIKAQIAATKTKTEGKLSIQNQLDSTYLQIKKAKIWEDPQKQNRLKAILKELSSLLKE
jgi:ParB family transcriptional regulator, chromosome partitioning protein